MLKRTMTAMALAGVLALPAYAQQRDEPANAPMMKIDKAPVPGTSDRMNKSDQMQKPHAAGAKGDMADQKVGFVKSQDSREWRGSKLIGASIYGPENKSIGEVNDVLIGDNGEVSAVVIGVGGFLGVGEKDVAIPFSALSIVRKQDSADIEKIAVSYSKDELKNAPKFAYLNADEARTTGAGFLDKMMKNDDKMKGDSKTMKK